MTLSVPHGFQLVEFCFQKRAQSPELRVHIPSPQHSYSDTSLQSSHCADNTSFTSSCNSDPDQVPPHAEQPARIKRKRTTFSPTEVWVLERAFKQRPYLTSEDEEELVQRLRIPSRSLRVSAFDLVQEKRNG